MVSELFPIRKGGDGTFRKPRSCMANCQSSAEAQFTSDRNVSDFRILPSLGSGKEERQDDTTGSTKLAIYFIPTKTSVHQKTLGSSGILRSNDHIQIGRIPLISMKTHRNTSANGMG
jgi:hypothetical protein